MGEFHAAAAGIETDPSGRSAHWRQASTWFQRCHDKFVEIRDAEQLWTSDAGVFDEIAAEIAKCDTAINQSPPASAPSS